MELKFGKLLGEDPKLTLAKIMARKANPDASYLEVEKSFMKNKGKLDDTMFNIPDDLNVEVRRPSNLAKPRLNVSRPVMNTAARPVRPIQRPPAVDKPPNRLPENSGNKSGDSNISLRKPSTFQEDDIETDKYSTFKVKPNLFLKMRKDSSEILNDVTLLKKPEVIQKPVSPEQEDVSAVKPLNPSELLHAKPSMASAVEKSDGIQQNRSAEELSDDIGVSIAKASGLDVGTGIGLRPPEKSGVEPHVVDSFTTGGKLVSNSINLPMEKALLGKPQRMESSVKDSRATGEVTGLNEESHKYTVDVGQVVPSNQVEREDSDWKLAEHLLHAGERAEVDLISCSGRGFVVSFGSLIGFLPYRNLGTKWKFLAFESWLRKKGLDPSLYRKNLSIIGSYDVPNKNLEMEPNTGQEVVKKDEEMLPSNMKFEDLLESYEKEKIKFLSSFVGQRTKTSVILADRNSRRLIFSGRPKEKEEVVEKKRSLMAKLSVGDVVKCRVKKITYFGIFVEIEGVPALIHQSEVSWDATLDPSSYFKIGQIVMAKVYQLDYALERITLSLKEITPDPLMEALESVVGDHTSLGGSLEAAQSDVEWDDVESLIQELQQVDGVLSVSKGRFFTSPGLAPTFQVYMGSTLNNKYKLLARYGNKVQEVVVQASLDKEVMKAAILACTNRVK